MYPSPPPPITTTPPPHPITLCPRHVPGAGGEVGDVSPPPDPHSLLGWGAGAPVALRSLPHVCPPPNTGTGPGSLPPHRQLLLALIKRDRGVSCIWGQQHGGGGKGGEGLSGVWGGCDMEEARWGGGMGSFIICSATRAACPPPDPLATMGLCAPPGIPTWGPQPHRQPLPRGQVAWGGGLVGQVDTIAHSW